MVFHEDGSGSGLAAGLDRWSVSRSSGGLFQSDTLLRFTLALHDDPLKHAERFWFFAPQATLNKPGEFTKQAKQRKPLCHVHICSK